MSGDGRSASAARPASRLSVSKVPPKDRAVEGIWWYITKNGLKLGDRLPSERALCDLLGVSRTALRAAIMQLVSSDQLESIHGSGTYVLPPKPMVIFQETYNYSNAVELAGRTPSSNVVFARMEVVDEGLSNKIDLVPGSPLFVVCRVRKVDGTPAAIETAYVNAERCVGIERHDYAAESLYTVLDEQYGIRVAHGSETISIARVREAESELLQVEPGTPAFFQESTDFDADMRPVEYCKAIVLPDWYRFANNGEAFGVKAKVGAEWLRS